jgi:hypothetical protein
VVVIARGYGGFPVRAKILYRHPRRSEEAGIVIVPDRAQTIEMKVQLEKRGYVVIKIDTAPDVPAYHQSD